MLNQDRGIVGAVRKFDPSLRNAEPANQFGLMGAEAPLVRKYSNADTATSAC